MKLYKGFNPDPRAWVYEAMKDIVDSPNTGFPHLDNTIHLLYDDLELLPYDEGSLRKYQGLDYLTERELELLSGLDRRFGAIIERLEWDASYDDYSAQPEWPIVVATASQVAKEMESFGVPQLGVDYPLDENGEVATSWVSESEY